MTTTDETPQAESPIAQAPEPADEPPVVPGDDAPAIEIVRSDAPDEHVAQVVLVPDGDDDATVDAIVKHLEGTPPETPPMMLVAEADILPDRWRNRIIGHGEEDPLQLLANPRNWRIHPKAQQDALTSVLDSIGWVASIKVNQRSGFVVDGHARVALAISRQEASVPVDYLDLTDAQEAVVIATFDAIGAQATADPEQVKLLLEEVQPDDATLLALLQKHAGGSFSPNYEPTVSLPTVTAEEVEEVKEEMEDQFAKERELREVSCPKCAGKFFVDAR